LQHVFGFTAFGVNVFVAREPGQVPHDEIGSGQEELYLVLRGSCEFTLDGEAVTGAALFVVAVRGMGVTRSAVALEADTALLAVGGRASDTFESTWLPSHFEGVPRLL
jgi:quercetin dioxygenase-like cupin family protein